VFATRPLCSRFPSLLRRNVVLQAHCRYWATAAKRRGGPSIRHPNAAAVAGRGRIAGVSQRMAMWHRRAQGCRSHTSTPQVAVLGVASHCVWGDGWMLIDGLKHQATACRETDNGEPSARSAACLCLARTLRWLLVRHISWLRIDKSLSTCRNSSLVRWNCRWLRLHDPPDTLAPPSH